MHFNFLKFQATLNVNSNYIYGLFTFIDPDSDSNPVPVVGS